MFEVRHPFEVTLFYGTWYRLIRICMDPELLPGSGSGINHSISSTLPLGHKLSSLGLKPGHIFFTIFVLQIYFHKKRQQQRRDHRILALWTVQIRMQVNNLNLQLQFYSYLFFIIHAARTFVVDLSLLHCPLASFITVMLY